jgi:hypothetical protein
VERLKQEKEQSEQKYEQKRKALKELESNVNKQTTKLERERAAAVEKCASLETAKADAEKQFQTEIQNLQGQVTQLKEALSKDKAAVLRDNEALRKQQVELEKDVVELQASHDGDKELWAGKFQFLEQQRNQARSDLAEAQKKFEATLDQLQKRGTLDKDKHDSNQAALITSLEQRHRAQLKEINETHQQLCTELTQKNKQLEKELRQLTEKTRLEQKGKQTEQGSLEKKVLELGETHAKLTYEMQEVKAERDKKLLEYQKLLEKEKEGYKSKLHDLESKCKEAESKRSALIFEFERERAKWAIEKDNLLTQKNEAQLIVDTLEKKKETLMLENEKLKTQRTTRKPLYAGAANYGGPGRYAGITAAKYKENYGKGAYVEDKPDSVETGSNSSSNAKAQGLGAGKAPSKPEDGASE